MQQPQQPQQLWFDGHLDLAFLAQMGRDMLRDPQDAGGSQLPAAVTFPSLAAGNVKAAFATIFICREITPEEAKRTNTDPDAGPWCFKSLADAPDAARRQIQIYNDWHNAGLIQIATRPPIENRKSKIENPLKVVILLEGAAGVRSPSDFQQFYDAGVRIVSLTWNEGSPYAGGDKTGTDVTPIGRDLLKELDRLNIIHDVSHLSEKAFWTVMSETRGIKVASHSNARALLPNLKAPERHLSDAQIKALAKNKDAVIGVVLYTRFILAGKESPRAAIADLMKHIAHIEQTAGRRDILALGSDMDGGFTQNELPTDLTLPAHYPRLAEALSNAGWTDKEIVHFAWNNWIQTLQKIGVTI